MLSEICPPLVRSARYLGEVPPLGGRDWQIHGQDGGQSIDLGDRSLFVFSDTLLTSTSNLASASSSAGWRKPVSIPNHRASRGFFLANCAGLSSSAGGADLKTCLASIRFFEDPRGWPREILSAHADERRRALRFWPQHGALIDGVVYLFYLGIQCIDPEKTWGFRCLGSGLARLDPVSGRCERLRRRGDWCLWPVIGDDFHLGVQVLRHEGWLYVFGSFRKGLDCSLRVARVRPRAIEDPESYEFLSSHSPKWSRRPAEAMDLGPCASEFSISYSPHLQRYLLSYIHPFDKVLTMRIAERPWGPFGPPSLVGRVPHRSSSELVFLAFEHPQFRAENGRQIFLTYSQPSFAPNSVLSVNLSEATWAEPGNPAERGGEASSSARLDPRR